MLMVAALPMAAPRTPSAGRPKQPKIRTAEIAMLTTLPTVAT